MKPLLVVPKATKPIEAVCWTPTQDGAQSGGWPRTKAWAVAKTWKVSAVDLTLFAPTQRPVLPGDWILRTPGGHFWRVRHSDFHQQYALAGPRRSG